MKWSLALSHSFELRYLCGSLSVAGHTVAQHPWEPTAETFPRPEVCEWLRWATTLFMSCTNTKLRNCLCSSICLNRKVILRSLWPLHTTVTWPRVCEYLLLNWTSFFCPFLSFYPISFLWVLFCSITRVMVRKVRINFFKKGRLSGDRENPSICQQK